MVWEIIFNTDFESEFDSLNESVQDECFAHLKLLEKFGPSLGRPHVDTLNESKHSNMKELRFNADNGVWRLAFAFDPKRQGILLICGDKSGGSQKRFYKNLIKKADKRFDEHLKIWPRSSFRQLRYKVICF
jgi:hypothetical protein